MFWTLHAFNFLSYLLKTHCNACHAAIQIYSPILHSRTFHCTKMHDHIHCGCCGQWCVACVFRSRDDLVPSRPKCSCDCMKQTTRTTRLRRQSFFVADFTIPISVGQILCKFQSNLQTLQCKQLDTLWSSIQVECAVYWSFVQYPATASKYWVLFLLVLPTMCSCVHVSAVQESWTWQSTIEWRKSQRWKAKSLSVSWRPSLEFCSWLPIRNMFINCWCFFLQHRFVWRITWNVGLPFYTFLLISFSLCVFVWV